MLMISVFLEIDNLSRESLENFYRLIMFFYGIGIYQVRKDDWVVRKLKVADV